MSLPSWERGLKPVYDSYFVAAGQSLPSWERGLKRKQSDADDGDLVGAWIETDRPGDWEGYVPSLPSWELGLKLHEIRRVGDIKAPFVGAWIETHTSGQICAISAVAPIMGTWIETRWLLFLYHFCGSLPSWEQGIKSDPL